MMSSAKLLTYEVCIPTCRDCARVVHTDIVSRLQACGFGKWDLFGIRCALAEALTNAIKHGNRSDPTKQIRIACWMDPSEVSIRVEDEGDGFAPHDVPDPTLAENLERIGGRGLLLMSELVDRVEFGDRGSAVTLRKFRVASRGASACGNGTRQSPSCPGSSPALGIHPRFH